MAEGAESAARRLLDDYCEALRYERNVSEHTLRAYRTDIEAFVAWAERVDRDPLALSHRDLRAFVADLDRARYARTTVSRRLSSVRGFYRWLCATKRIDANPTDGIAGSKRRAKLPRVIRPREMARILAVCGPCGLDGVPREQTPSELRDAALLEFLYASGVRVSEACGLRLAALNLDYGEAKVFGKGSKERIVPIHDAAIASMRAYLERGRPALLRDRDNGFFFVSNRGGRLSEDVVRRMFRRVQLAAGFDGSYTPHDIRHTFATDVLDGGADLRSVQELLGHASVATTQIYTAVTAAALREVFTLSHPRARGTDEIARQ